MFDKIVTKLKEIFMPSPPIESFMVYKDTGGEYRFVARYSNNILDNDIPKPEIISERSHRLFVERVEKGLSPYPELWLWHVPEWKLGKSNLVTYDDSGFALAAGNFNKGKEYDEIAEWLSTQHMLTSHGMPIKTVRYDPNDPRVIVEHETREISPLPPQSAANKRTGFGVYISKEQEEQTMTIPINKKEQLIKMGLTEDQLNALEAMNVAEAAAAKEAGIATKELQSVPTPTPASVPVPETVPAPVPIPPPDPPVRPVPIPPPDPPLPGASKEATVGILATAPIVPIVPVTRDEIAEAIGATLNPLLERMLGLEASLSGLSKQVKELAQTDEAKIVEKAQNVPAASLGAMIMQRMIGNKATLVAANDPLVNSKPKETAPGGLAKTGVPMLDSLLALQDKK